MFPNNSYLYFLFKSLVYCCFGDFFFSLPRDPLSISPSDLSCMFYQESCTMSLDFFIFHPFIPPTDFPAMAGRGSVTVTLSSISGRQDYMEEKSAMPTQLKNSTLEVGEVGAN